MKIAHWWPHVAAVACLALMVGQASPVGLRIAISIAATLAWTFVGLYVGRSNWRATRIGKVMAFTNVAMASLLTQIALSEWTNLAYPLRNEVRTTLYTAIGYGLVWKIGTLIRAQRGGD